MTHTRQLDDSEGEFKDWVRTARSCEKIIPTTGLPCGHPVEYRLWESSDGAYEDFQYRCIGGGHIWWVEGADS